MLFQDHLTSITLLNEDLCPSQNVILLPQRALSKETLTVTVLNLFQSITAEKFAISKPYSKYNSTNSSLYWETQSTTMLSLLSDYHDQAACYFKTVSQVLTILSQRALSWETSTACLFTSTMDKWTAISRLPPKYISADSKRCPNRPQQQLCSFFPNVS